MSAINNIDWRTQFAPFQGRRNDGGMRASRPTVRMVGTGAYAVRGIGGSKPPPNGDEGTAGDRRRYVTLL